MSSNEQSKYWLDLLVGEILAKYPKGEITVSSGVAPSGIYHVGHMREVLTADAITYAIREAGRQAKHLHFVDDLDPLRKVPIGAPKEYEKFIGQPVSAVPDLFGCDHQSYAEHFLSEFLDVIEPLKIKMEVLRSHQLYKAGKFTKAMDTAMTKLKPIREIIGRVTGRELPEDWTPIQLFEDGKNFRNVRLDEWDEVRALIPEGRVKLSWRLDWTARWHEYAVQVEPFGRDHATKGGSYDTGKELVKAVFGSEPPFPVPYEFINLQGETKKMSASSGTGLTPAQVLDVMPPEVLRYFVLKSKPERTLVFDPGLGLYRLLEEFTAAYQSLSGDKSHPYVRTADIALGESAAKDLVISSAPFDHLVSSYQAALGDYKQTLNVLERTGWKPVNENEDRVLKKELKFVGNWLEKYAPDEVKFEVQPKLPKVELSDAQKQFLADLADGLEKESDLNGQGIHDLVYACREKADLKPLEAFQAIYRVLLGKDSGPRAGWFLESLDRSFVLDRLRLIA